MSKCWATSIDKRVPGEEEEFREWMKKAGYTFIERTDLKSKKYKYFDILEDPDICLKS